ncbi:MAG: trehalose-phosphatase [candidate division NC10 bacterium]|nr:trehalose-phosphatase [candidate division NC10 bacterium]
MQWLWSRWPQVEERIRKSRHTLLLLDFDGTLARIVPLPKQVALPPSTKSALRRLSRSSAVSVALISGRRLTELKRLVGLRNAIYIGNHGLEIMFKGVRMPVVVPRSSHEALTRLRPRLAGFTADVPGARIEDKGISLSLHYRLVRGTSVARLKAAFRGEVSPFVRSGVLTVLNGKRVLEVRPGVNWTKGHAALWLLKRMRRRSLLPIYIGDDRTDEDAFGMLKAGITIRVGFHSRSKAEFFVRGTMEVLSLLQWLAATYA